MEDKSGFERLLNTSQGHIVPKRLSFDFLNSTEMSTKKRKRDDAQFEETMSTSKTLNETINSSAGSLSSSITAPWEMKMLRIDLTEAQTRVS